MRFLKDDEKCKIIPLYKEVFDDSDFFVKYYFDNIAAHTEIIVIEIDEEIISMASIHQKTLTINHKFYKAGYVYGVATKEEYRKQGYMGKILEEIEKYAFENQYDYLYLIPANPRIYEKYGYKNLREKKEFIYKKDKYCVFVNIKKADKTDISKMIEFVESNYGNCLNTHMDEKYFLTSLERLSLNNSGIYCIFHKECDRISGVAFLEEYNEIYIENLLCNKDLEMPFVNSILDFLGRDEALYEIHDIMFKEICSKLNDIREYYICINDEV